MKTTKTSTDKEGECTKGKGNNVRRAVLSEH